MNKKVAVMGELLLRLSTPGKQRFLNSTSFDINYGGAELNVAVNLATLGIDVKAITKVAPNEIGNAAIRNLKSYGVNTDHIARGGERVGIYFLETGHSIRNSKVVYDRKDSAFSKTTISDYDIDAVFEGVSLFHVSGITLAISQETFQVAEFFMKEAQARGIKVSFDFNYRSKLWSHAEARVRISKILKYVDIAFAGYLDFINILGYKTDKTDISEIYEELYPKVIKDHDFEYIVSSVRNVVSASKNIYRGICCKGRELIFSKEYHIDIIDRVGSGDAFAAGFLFGYLMNASDNYKVEFAAGAAAMKHTIAGDSNLVVKEEIETLFKSNSLDDGFDVGR